MRVLFLTHRLPYAPNRGDRIRAHHILHLLAQHFHVDVVSLVHDRDEEAQAAALRSARVTVQTHRVPRWSRWCRAASVLAGPTPLTHALLDSPSIRAGIDRIVTEGRPDVVVAYCSGMARFATEPPLDRLPFVFDMVDVDSNKWGTLARHAGWPKGWVYSREARCLAQFEGRAARAASTTLVVNEREAVALRRIAPGARIVVAQNGVDVDRFRPPAGPAREARVVFCGVMNYGPNVDAARWLAESIWPIVRNRRPDARLSLVGSSPDVQVRRLARDPTIEVTGTVPDVRDFLWKSAVAVAPLRVARGVQNKVLEAAAARLPVVVTPAVAEGLPPEAAPACSVADRPEAIAEAILLLLDKSGPERRRIAARAELHRLSWHERLRPLLDAIEDAAATQRAA